MKIRTRLTLSLGLGLTLGLGTLLAIASFAGWSYIKSSLMETIRKSGIDAATKVSSVFERHRSAAQILARTAEIFQKTGVERSAVFEYVETVLRDQVNYAGVWLVFEPDAYDHTDSADDDEPWSNWRNQLSPLWYRINGDIGFSDGFVEESLKDHADFYYGALGTGKSYMTKPQTYEYVLNAGDENGSDEEKIKVTLVSFAHPIGTPPIGVAGLDVDLGFLQSATAGIHPVPEGWALLVDPNGTVLAHPDVRQVGSLFDKLPEYANDSSFIRTEVPVVVDPNGKQWTLWLVAPSAAVEAPLTMVLTGLLAMGLGGLSLLIFLNWWILRSALKPLEGTRKALRGIASGQADLTSRLNVKGDEEVAELASDFNKFVSSLQGLLISLKTGQGDLSRQGEVAEESSQEVAAAIRQISQTLSQIDGRMTDQNRDVESVRSALDTFESELKELQTHLTSQKEAIALASETSQETARALAESAAMASGLAAEMRQLLGNSDEANHRFNSVSRGIDAINRQSESLAEANMVIADIAAWTNLLAVNADIEASHAGTAGRGFAVVAEEIRKLAETSNSQSQRIEDNLHSIKSDIEEIVSASQAAGQALGVVSDKVTRTSRTVDEFADKVRVQGGAAKTVYATMETLEVLTQGVGDAQKKMTGQAKNFRMAIVQLEDAAKLLAHNTAEISAGTKAIQESADGIARMSVATREGLSAIDRIVGEFRL